MVTNFIPAASWSLMLHEGPADDFGRARNRLIAVGPGEKRRRLNVLPSDEAHGY